MFRLGKDMKLFYSVNGAGPTPAPVWVELTNIRDLTLGLEADRSDLSTRGSGGWRQEVATLKSASIQFSIVWDTVDPGFEALKDAFLNSTVIGIQCLDGEEAGTPPGQGIQSDMAVFNFTRNEELTEGVTVDVELGIAYGAAPIWLPVALAADAGAEGEDGGAERGSRRRGREPAGV